MRHGPAGTQHRMRLRQFLCAPFVLADALLNSCPPPRAPVMHRSALRLLLRAFLRSAARDKGNAGRTRPPARDAGQTRWRPRVVPASSSLPVRRCAGSACTLTRWTARPVLRHSWQMDGRRTIPSLSPLWTWTFAPWTARRLPAQSARHSEAHPCRSLPAAGRKTWPRP